MNFDLSFLKTKWGIIGVCTLIVGVLGIVLYQVYKINKDITDAAASVNKGAIGETVGNNVAGVFQSVWDDLIYNPVKNLFSSNSATTAVNTVPTGA